MANLCFPWGNAEQGRLQHPSLSWTWAPLWSQPGLGTMDCHWWKHQVKITREKEKAPVLGSSSKGRPSNGDEANQIFQGAPNQRGGRSPLSSSRKFAVVSSSLRGVPWLSLYSPFSQYSWELATADFTLSLQRNTLSSGGQVTSPLSDPRSSPLAISRTGPGPSTWEMRGCQQGFQGHARLRIMTVWSQGQGESCFHPRHQVKHYRQHLGQVTLSSIQDFRLVECTARQMDW